MMTNPNMPILDHETLADAEDALRVAVSLGYAPPVFSGSVVYYASVTDSGDGTTPSHEDLGIYDSEDAARMAVRNWVVVRCYEMGHHPLLEGASGEEDTSNQDDYSDIPDGRIISSFFQYWDDETSYSIEKRLIMGMPEREI